MWHRRSLADDPPIVSRASEKAQSERLLTAALTIGLLSAACALVFFSWLGHVILTDARLAFDEEIRMAVHGLASPRLTAVMRGLSLYGGPGVLTPIGIL